MSAVTPLIIDVDTGIDDSLALLYACRVRRGRVLAVTCVSGNVEAQTGRGQHAARCSSWSAAATSRSRSAARCRWFGR